MGWIRHHGIVVTSWDEKAIRAAHIRAQSLFGKTLVTDITPAAMNGYRSFLIAPDGSKEGWSDSDDGDARRCTYRSWLNDQAYEYGSSALDWIEYEHDHDGGTAKVLNFTEG